MDIDVEDEDKKIMRSFLDSLKSERVIEIDERTFFQPGDDHGYHVYVSDKEKSDYPSTFTHFYVSIARQFATQNFMYIEVEFLECEYTEGTDEEIDAMYAKWLKEDTSDFKKAFPRTSKKFKDKLKFTLTEH